MSLFPEKDNTVLNILLNSLWQERETNAAAANGPLDGMRNLETYLSDLLGAANSDYAKGIPVDTPILAGNSPCSSPHSSQSVKNERYSRKVFVGGLPPDIDEDEIADSFKNFVPFTVDWPHKLETKSNVPPKGYCFIIFQFERSVQQLMDSCCKENDKLYMLISSRTTTNKAVQIRPWRLSDADYVLDTSALLDPRKTVFVGGVPRPLKASELASIMNYLYGGVSYVGIDLDPALKYPKGAARIAFNNKQSFMAAISDRFVKLQHYDVNKRVEVKPYIFDAQMCDYCGGMKCGFKDAPFYCTPCLQYYCEHCWTYVHSRRGRELHKPLMKIGFNKPRPFPFYWCSPGSSYF